MQNRPLAAPTATLFSRHNPSKTVYSYEESIQEYIDAYRDSLSTELSAADKMRLLRERRELLLNSLDIIKAIEKDPAQKAGILSLAQSSMSEIPTLLSEAMTMAAPMLLGHFFPKITILLMIVNYTHGQKVSGLCKDIANFLNSKTPHTQCDGDTVTVSYYGHPSESFSYVATYNANKFKTNVTEADVMNVKNCMHPGLNDLVKGQFKYYPHYFKWPANYMYSAAQVLDADVQATLHTSQPPTATSHQILSNFSTQVRACINNDAAPNLVTIPSVPHAVNPTVAINITSQTANASYNFMLAFVAVSAFLIALGAYFTFQNEKPQHGYNLRPRKSPQL